MTSHRPAVTAVCLTTYPRRAEMLDQSITSFALQSFLGAELVIVNDGAPIRSCYPRQIAVVNVPSGTSIGAKRNAGTAAARGEMIATWDDDDLSFEDRLGRQYAALVSDPRVGCCRTGSMWVTDEALRIRGLLLAPSYATGMMRVDLLQKIGGYPDLSYLEDMEVHIRLRMRGLRIRTTQDAFYVYRRHRQNISSMHGGEQADAHFERADSAHPELPAAQARLDGMLAKRAGFGPFVEVRTR